MLALGLVNSGWRSIHFELLVELTEMEPEKVTQEILKELEIVSDVEGSRILDLAETYLGDW